jgi:hypothetical protein
MLELLNKTFNNREIALIFYLVLFIVWTMTKKDIRESIFRVIKSMFAKKILISILILLIYISVIVVGLSFIDLWNSKLIKDTIYWTFGTGFILMVNSNKALNEEKYFGKILKDNIKLLVIVEFIVGLYVFGIITEFILMPIVILLSALLGYTEVYEEHRRVKNLLLKIFGFGGLYYLVYSGYNIYQNFKGLVNYDNIRAFLFPIIMIVLILPYAYFYALYMHYESLFVRVGFFLKDNKVLCRYAKWRILLEVNFSFKKLRLITPGLLFSGCKTKMDIKQEITRKLNE